MSKARRGRKRPSLTGVEKRIRKLYPPPICIHCGRAAQVVAPRPVCLQCKATHQRKADRDDPKR